MSFRIDGDIFQGQDQPVDGKTQVILETRDILYRRYTASQTLPAIDLLIVCSGDNRKGTHPPQVCLTGGGASIVSQQDRPLILNDGTVLPLRELISREKNVLKYHLYVYKCGKRYTPSFFRQQASIFMSGLLQRNIAGSMIRLSVCVNGEEIDNAREMAFKAAAAIWPTLDGRLP
jgi:EpsI family protein